MTTASLQGAERSIEVNRMGQTLSDNEAAADRPLEIAIWQRRASVLTRPQIPCMRDYHTINLSAGCPNECRYCYAQSYAYHPGWGKVAFYANAREKLRKELAGMRQKPRLVYFSTACEPFLPAPPVLKDLYEIMAMLLEAGASLVISTKSVIPDCFVGLFARYPGKVLVQVGITTTDDRVRRVIEPRAAGTTERMDNLARLARAGVGVEARIDPLIPGLTDTRENLDALISELARIEIHEAVVSFLFLRWGIKFPRDLTFGNWSSRAMRRRYTLKVTDYCGGGTIWLPALEYRLERLRWIQGLADANGIHVKICHCKNGDIPEAQWCQPTLSDPHAPNPDPQLTLFERDPSK